MGQTKTETDPGMTITPSLRNMSHWTLYLPLYHSPYQIHLLLPSPGTLAGLLLEGDRYLPPFHFSFSLHPPLHLCLPLHRHSHVQSPTLPPMKTLQWSSAAPVSLQLFNSCGGRNNHRPPQAHNRMIRHLPNTWNSTKNAKPQRLPGQGRLAKRCH